MMTQPIQTLENLTSETTPAGGNAGTKTGIFAWAPFKRLFEAVRADFRLRAAEAQLVRMTDRELADLGLNRSDIPFAIRRANDAAVAGVAPLIGRTTASSQAAIENLRHIAA
jgi:uncharacterized protein YjiS (DUF1127 family)